MPNEVKAIRSVLRQVENLRDHLEMLQGDLDHRVVRWVVNQYPPGEEGVSSFTSGTFHLKDRSRDYYVTVQEVEGNYILTWLPEAPSSDTPLTEMED